MEAVQKLEQAAKLSFGHLENANRQVCDLIDELMREKTGVLNRIVSDYMLKSFQFHKRANQ